jgi:hypothetical protein
MRKGATGNLKSKLILNPAIDWNSVAPLTIRVTGHLYCPDWEPYRTGYQNHCISKIQMDPERSRRFSGPL